LFLPAPFQLASDSLEEKIDVQPTKEMQPIEDKRGDSKNQLNPCATITNHV
jgi:hypothetical protein